MMNQPSLLDLLLLEQQQRRDSSPSIAMSVDPLEGKGAQAQLTPQQQEMLRQFQQAMPQMQQQPLDLSYQSSDNDMFNRAMSGEFKEGTQKTQDWFNDILGGSK
jgi:hypothetical protein